MDENKLFEACQLAAGIPARYKGASLADFPDLDAPSFENPHSIFIGGDNGTGKTHLSAALCGLWASQGIQCLFVTAYDAASAIRENRGHFDPHSNLATAQVLFIDDITSVKDKKWDIDHIFKLLDHRYSNWGDGIRETVVSSNLTPSQWGNLHGAIWKVLSGFRKIERKEAWNG